MGWGEAQEARGLFAKLPAEKVAWLEAVAAEQGVSISSLLGDAVDVLRELMGGPVTETSERLLSEAIARLG